MSSLVTHVSLFRQPWHYWLTFYHWGLAIIDNPLTHRDLEESKGWVVSVTVPVFGDILSEQDGMDMAIKSEQAVPGVMRWKSAIVGETVRQYRRIIHPDKRSHTAQSFGIFYRGHDA